MQFPIQMDYSKFSANFITYVYLLDSDSSSNCSERHPPISNLFSSPYYCYREASWIVKSTFYRQPGVYRKISFRELWVRAADCDHILWDVVQIPRIDNHHFNCTYFAAMRRRTLSSITMQIFKLRRVVRKYPIVMKSCDIVEFRCKHFVHRNGWNANHRNY